MSHLVLRKSITASPVFSALLLATLLAGCAYALEGRLGLDLGDEGYLWYGARATAAGEVPLRDFQSYEPGRYYWCALWFWLLRDQGILSLRIAMAAFEAIGLTCGLLVLRRVVGGLPLLALAGILLSLWFEPRFRVFEITLTLVATLVGVRLLERPTVGRQLTMGLLVGMAAIFGRNHGVYLAVAAGLLCLLSLSTEGPSAPRRIGALLAGVFLGVLPILLMVAFVPGFRLAVVRSIELSLETGAGLPRDLLVPGLNTKSRQVVFGTVLLLLPVVYCLSALSLLWTARSAGWCVRAAGTIVGTVYLHHIYFRPELMHLASGIAPFFVVLLSFTPRTWHSATLLLLAVEFALTQGTILKHHPLPLFRSHHLASIKVMGDRIFVTPWQADLIRVLKIHKGGMTRSDDLLIAPDMPGLYPILKRRAPVWRLQFIFPEPERRQDELISRLETEDVQDAFLCDVPFDGRDELRFRNAFPKVFSYLQGWKLESDPVPPMCEVRSRP